MRRKDKEIVSLDEKLQVIDKCKICRLGVSEKSQPYVIPMNFGYQYQNDELTLYFHSANEGKKLDILKKNPKICFEMDCGHDLIAAEAACNYGYAFESVIGFGTVQFIEDSEEKSKALHLLMKHQTGKIANYTFGEQHLSSVTIYKVVTKSFTGKSHRPH